MSLSGVRRDRGRLYRWQIAPRVSSDELRRIECHRPLLAQLLFNRGIADPDHARRFLAADAEALGDPLLMAGLDAALVRLGTAIESGELIAVYGDYDVDGLTATAVLCLTLGHLGARVLPFIPHREKDGYGLQDGPLTELRAAGATLVVTVDCGVTAAAEIASAHSAGLEVIVTDHHLVPAVLPEAIVLNPNRPDCEYPFKELAGVGVAFKLAQALLAARLDPDQAEALIEVLLELVAIGTLADVVPLTGENRTIVCRGLRRLNATKRPGLRALFVAAGLEPGAVDADRVCYALAPRLNAAGRLEHARLALDLLLTDSPNEASALADHLDELNRSRQALTADALQAARAELGSRQPGAALVLAGPYPLGIAGLVAGRIAEQYNRPTIVLRSDGKVCIGSARSVPGFNVVEAMRRGSEYLDRFGGHAMAAGLSLQLERLPAFQAAFEQAVSDVRGPVPPERELTVEAELRPATAASWQTLELLTQLEPHGAGNPAPLFMTRGLLVTETRPVGSGHLRARLASPEIQLTAIGFGMGEAALTVGERVDVVYRLRRNVWRDTIASELELLDWRTAEE